MYTLDPKNIGTHNSGHAFYTLKMSLLKYLLDFWRISWNFVWPLVIIICENQNSGHIFWLDATIMRTYIIWKFRIQVKKRVFWQIFRSFRKKMYWLWRFISWIFKVSVLRSTLFYIWLWQKITKDQSFWSIFILISKAFIILFIFWI